MSALSEAYDRYFTAYNALLLARRGPDAGTRWRYSRRKYRKALSEFEAATTAVRKIDADGSLVRAMLIATTAGAPKRPRQKRSR